MTIAVWTLGHWDTYRKTFHLQKMLIPPSKNDHHDHNNVELSTKHNVWFPDGHFVILDKSSVSSVTKKSQVIFSLVFNQKLQFLCRLKDNIFPTATR